MSKETALGMIPASAPVAPPPVAPIEGVSTQPSPETPKELDSTRLSSLMKKEAEIVKEREALKKEREANLTEKEKIKAIQENLSNFEQMKAKDPMAALKLLGFSEKDLMNFISAEKENISPEEIASRTVKNELDKYKEEQARKEQELTLKRNEQILTQFKSDITKAVTADPDKYEFINHNGAAAEELIYETVNNVLQDSGELISIQEAAEMVEGYYEEMYKNMSNLKKVKPKEEVATEAPKDEPLKPQVSPRPSPAKTLTSKETATTASTTIYKRESSDEKKQRLIKKYLYS